MALQISPKPCEVCGSKFIPHRKRRTVRTCSRSCTRHLIWSSKGTALERAALRLSENSTPEPNSGCILWTGPLNAWGYGEASLSGKRILAHRLAHKIHRGEIGPGLLVLHRCDTPACVNPDHLWLGTNAENMRDMASKGRAYKPGDQCARGHTYEFLPGPKLRRICKICRADNQRKRQAAKKLLRHA